MILLHAKSNTTFKNISRSAVNFSNDRFIYFEKIEKEFPSNLHGIQTQISNIFRHKRKTLVVVCNSAKLSTL